MVRDISYVIHGAIIISCIEITMARWCVGRAAHAVTTTHDDSDNAFGSMMTKNLLRSYQGLTKPDQNTLKQTVVIILAEGSVSRISVIWKPPNTT